MRQKEKLKENWDIFWDSEETDAIFGEDFILNSHQGKITFDILKKCKNNISILEAGCGLGNWVILFEKLGFNAYGIDISPKSLQKADILRRKNGLKEKFVLGDIRITPFKNEVFDVVVSYGVIEHFPNSRKALKDFYRILKPGGICFITTPNPFCFHRLIGRHILNITKSSKLGYVGYEDAYTPKQLCVMLTDSGFKCIDSGILTGGMGSLFGIFWPMIPLIGKPIFNFFLKLGHFIETRQKVVGAGSFAVACKAGP